MDSVKGSFSTQTAQSRVRSIMARGDKGGKQLVALGKAKKSVTGEEERGGAFPINRANLIANFRMIQQYHQEGLK